MTNTWQKLTKMTGGKEILIEKIRIREENIAIEGSFEPPPLARIGWEDQIFIAAFIRAHGSIKEMERLFGVSYPTVKNRLNRIAGSLNFIKVDTSIEFEPVNETGTEDEDSPDPLELLERGEIDFETALKKLKENKS